MSEYIDSPSGEGEKNLFDNSSNTKYLTHHSGGWVQYTFAGNAAYAANKYALVSANDQPSRDPKSWTLEASNDGKNWTVLDKESNIYFQKREQTVEFPIRNTTKYKTYRLNILDNNGSDLLQLSEIKLFRNDKNLIKYASAFSSRWISPASDSQWIYVDLGTVCKIHKVRLYWNNNYAKAYRIDVSENRSDWKTIWSTTNGNGSIDQISFPEVSARYVRLSGIKRNSAASGYSLSEFQVYGKGEPVVTARPQPAIQKNGLFYLSGGNWKLQRASLVAASGEQLSRPAFDAHSWMIATVPGTVLTSYLNDGALPDPNFGDQQLQISDSFFYSDFWYRDSFVVPESYSGKRVWLNFNGINWKADIYFNGNKLGHIYGAFIRGKFDVTPYIKYGQENDLAVRIHKNATPGRATLQDLKDAGHNGGVLGADNPTIHASIGWDWIPTIRGRDIGIQDKVYLSSSQAITISDPFIITQLPLPDTTSARLTLKVKLTNHASQTVSGELKGSITPGNISFSKQINLKANESKTIILSPGTTSGLLIHHPKLWWPNGYGPQNMYNMHLLVDESSGEMSDQKEIPFGIRQVTTDTTNQIMTLFVNGKRIFARGGNWGISESMLRLNKEGYDVRVRLHKEANFNMIRNWIGMTGDEDFYNACDKYGIMIWDDFWLANPGDGPNPNDPDMFMANAKDKINHFRNHPSVVLYCGRNEGNPPASLASRLVKATSELDGTRPYIPSSATGAVSGFGPYSVQNPQWYFKNRGGKKIHSEMGMPNIPVIESMKRMLPSDKLWPINDMWGIHDFCNSAQGERAFVQAVNNSYGTAEGIDDFCQKAQMVDMENHKAMFEAFVASKGNGMLMWMSNPAWPTTVWQTYDYYLDENAGYFGCKKACEPLHILWDSYDNSIRVANNTLKNYKNLIAEAKVYNLDGTGKYARSVSIDIAADSVVNCFTIHFPKGLSATHFLRLKLLSGKHVLSDNFYWRGNTYQNYKALSDMAEVRLTGKASGVTNGEKCRITATITNPNSEVALMIRAKLVTSPTGERVLPSFYSDNYFSLLPAESKTITIEVEKKNLAGGVPRLMLEGWNIIPSDVQLIGCE